MRAILRKRGATTLTVAFLFKDDKFTLREKTFGVK